ncbi:alpha-mannosidase 2C1-like [Paramacrobiotus metropolitanus]|uniref:alpha-mannosidase 2C1-like n=1 Tax=Paramacrobiotus metropolitanus TaxID=2943436 RepID=UPI002445CA89|nr:alpha-mannosidase 2C1-like [Paramacrobiotus metropolitanus]
MDSVVASLTKNRRTTFERIEKFLSKDYFADVGLRARIYPATQPVVSILHWNASAARTQRPLVPHPSHDSDSDGDDDSGPEWKVPVPGRDAFAPYTLGEPFGPTWSTHWFIVDICIPEAWIGREVHLLWDSGSEAMLYEAGGTVPLQAFSGGIDFQMRDCYVLSKQLTAGQRQRELWLEVACNDLFGAGAGGMINPPDPAKTFSVKKAAVALFDREVFDLFTDFEILFGMAKCLPENNPRNYQAMYLANHIINTFKTDPSVKISQLRKLTSEFFAQKNGDSQHEIFALGHCHIDCAWLWAYDETIRKCGRSWITMIRLMEEYPDFRFVASSAQQFRWVKDHYPVVYEQIKKFVKKGQFLPVGGTWVEMDGNLPSGESFVRQFLYGQKFFQEEFGIKCDTFWLPDTFGYSAQLPQIMRQAGIKYFLSAKLSWSLVNSFPHHNFLWRGIDGSEVLAHFPPGESYGMNVTVEDALKTVEKLKDKGRVAQSMMLYGYGDGGGGPTPVMIERGRRMKDVDGIPKISLDKTVADFFAAMEKDRKNLNVWSGELYLELHNGTYTTQAELKRNIRMAQNLFRDGEFLDAVMYAFIGIEPVDRREQWQDFLLQQFHDVLPGTSIGKVFEDANNILGSLIDTLNQDCVSALNFLSSSQPPYFNASCGNIHYRNPQSGIFAVLPPYSMTNDIRYLNTFPYTIKIEKLKDDSIRMENQFLIVTMNRLCVISSMLLKKSRTDVSRECVFPSGRANELVLFDDVPLYWDAWDCMDYHLEAPGRSDYQVVSFEIGQADVTSVFRVSDACPVRMRLFMHPAAPIVQVECDVDWKERHKFLKMQVDANVTSENRKATYEIQHGWLERPAHRNTSWDWAKFEVCCQRWADVSEYGFGVSVINLTNQGFSVRNNTMSLSLLRSPKAPDPEADMGVHPLKYAIMPHWGSFQEAQLIQHASSLNDTWDPAYETPTDSDQAQRSGLVRFFTISDPAVILDAVKTAENGQSRAIVIRLYESYGGSAVAAVETLFPVEAVQECDLLENFVGEKTPVKDKKFVVTLRAFEVKSFVVFLTSTTPGHW